MRVAHNSKLKIHNSKLFKSVVECVVKDTARAQHVNDVVVALRILVREGEAGQLVVGVAVLRLRVCYRHLLAHVRMPVLEVDHVHLLRAQQLVGPVGHSERHDARVSLELAGLHDVVVAVVAAYVAAVTLVRRSHRMRTRAVQQLLDTE